MNLLEDIKPGKATGSDGIPARFISESRDIICTPLTYLVNLSLAKGQVPPCLKNAKVVPLFKKGNRSDVGNYRPVSILPVLSKILEKVVHSQLECYLNSQNLVW